MERLDGDSFKSHLSVSAESKEEREGRECSRFEKKINDGIRVMED